MPANNINSGETLIRKEAVVAGKYLSPQKSAPLPMVYALRPITNRRIHKRGEMGGEVLPLRTTNGSNTTKAPKYRSPAIVNGPM